MKKLHLLLFSLIIFSACAQNTIYYWGEYPNTLCQYRKDADEKSLNNHIDQLEKIITTSNRRHIRVAPGLQAELGYYYVQLGRVDEAIKLFNVEMEVYPESSVLMTKMIGKVGGTKE